MYSHSTQVIPGNMNEDIKVINKEDAEILIRQLLNIGEAMYICGAEISRIEDSLHRLGKVYGARHVSVYAITSNIVVTVEFDNNYSISQNRRIVQRESIDCTRMEQLNQLLRECSTQKISVYELRSRVLKILETKPNAILIVLGQFISALAFTIFFGGNLFDSIVAGLLALVIAFMQKRVRPYVTSMTMFNLEVSLVLGVIVSSMCLVFPTLHINQILIGDIMVLIPGVAITNSIRYILSGDTISSFEKLIDSVLQAFGIALGFLIALLLIKTNINVPTTSSGVIAVIIQLVAAFCGTFGFCLIYNVSTKHILVPSFGGLICWGIYLAMQQLGLNFFLCVLIASLFVGIYGEIFARIDKVPTTVLFIPASIPLIPGSNLYYSALAICSSDWNAFASNTKLLALCSLGIAVGLAVVVEFERMITKIKKRNN